MARFLFVFRSLWHGFELKQPPWARAAYSSVDRSLERERGQWLRRRQPPFTIHIIDHERTRAQAEAVESDAAARSALGWGAAVKRFARI